ncbi:unnamed protein product [Dovyalis caffra]|uniref:Uncharacterized protein n=1 Tax=Dovyalis caffra TaxID=77055 RepID=A0AAV1QQK7_9ROSI|nr:unnamed protein product [Dovyalis caffra]
MVNGKKGAARSDLKLESEFEWAIRIPERAVRARASVKLAFPSLVRLSRKELSHWLNEIRSKSRIFELKSRENLLPSVRERVALSALGAASKGLSNKIRNGPKRRKGAGRSSGEKEIVLR